MTDVDADRPPLRLRLYAALGKEPEWSQMTADELRALQLAVNRKRASPLARVITGRMDSGADAEWQDLALPGRLLPVRVYRPIRRRLEQTDRVFPLVLHVHGGGFVGTAAQSDWVNSHLAARLPAVVISVEHRLLAPDTPLSEAVDDGWEALEHVLGAAEQWGIDADRVAVFGESTGGLIAALSAIRARDAGHAVRAQVLANPCLDVASAMSEWPSYSRYADNPTLTTGQMEMFLRLAVPPGADAAALSPLRLEDLSGLAAALIIVPTYDPISDQGDAMPSAFRRPGPPCSSGSIRGRRTHFSACPRSCPRR